MRIDVITIFPDYLAPLSLSLVGKAIEAGIFAGGPMTGITPPTTPPTAEGPGW